MKILLACMRHSYGDPKRELSYEYFNFFLVLQEMGHEVDLFDYMAEIADVGKSAMNQKLLSKACEWQPDVAIFSLYTDQFDAEIILSLRKHTRTFCFFHDDTWRVEYSKYWAERFDYFSTPDLRGEVKYREIGLLNAIYFPFGCNENIFRKLDVEKQHDVSFVGAWHPHREWVLKRLKKAGISVGVFGYRWPQGEISQEQMVRCFNESRINLNLSNSASWDIRYLASSPRACVNRLRSRKNVEQMKARVFEVAGCGAFQLSYFVEGLSNCYEIDRELAVYADADDLIDKVKFYLAHDALRESMALSAYARTIEQHTFRQRFMSVFARMGLLHEV